MTKAPTWADIPLPAGAVGTFEVASFKSGRPGRTELWVEITLTPEAWEAHSHCLVVGAVADMGGGFDPGRVSHVWPERHTFRVEWP